MKPAPINQKIFKPKIRIEYGDDYKFVQNTVSSNKLYGMRRSALSEYIRMLESRYRYHNDTRRYLYESLRFCSVKTGKPQLVDTMEHDTTTMAVKKMKLRHVVITSVDRDDLKADYGASIWAETIEQIHHNVPGCTVEVLTPDFQGYKPALHTVFKAGPEIFSHNVECVERISKKVRAQAVWSRSLNVLKESVDYGLRTKTGIMLGLELKLKEKCLIQ